MKHIIKTNILEFLNNKYAPNINAANKEYIKPVFGKGEPEKRVIDDVWLGGYQFNRFLGNCYELLGELAENTGIQQLIHCYYLNNGGINAKDTVKRIKNFIGV